MPLTSPGGWRVSAEAASAVHEQRVAGSGRAGIPSRAWIAYVPGFPTGILRYHNAAYFAGQWTGRRWTSFGGLEPIVLDVTDMVPALYRELFDRPHERVLKDGREVWPRTHITFREG